MSFVTRRLAAFSTALILLTASGSAVRAQQKYEAGITDTEIKVGNIMPYSGPASAYGVIGRTEAAYFRKINAEGGLNGRKINFISYDDAYSPPKAVEQARRLVEGDEVFLIFGALGTPSNTAIQKYMNAKKVPQQPPIRWIPSSHDVYDPGRMTKEQTEGRCAGTRPSDI